MEGEAPLPGSAAATARITISPGKFCSRSGPLFTPHHDPARGFEFTTPRNPRDGPRSPHWGGVAFADELFQDGRILPLKLPPRLQHACPSTPGGRSPLRGSPASSWQRRLLCRPGGGHKKDDLDPFTAALERIRKAEPAGEGRRGFPTRRARSLSPLRRANWGGGSGSKGRRAPSPQPDHPWQARPLKGPVLASPASWTGDTHGQAMETSSEGSSGSEIRLAEGDGEGGGVEDSELSAAAGAREGGGGVRKRLGKKKAFSISSWRGLFFCMGVPCEEGEEWAFSKKSPLRITYYSHIYDKPL